MTSRRNFLMGLLASAAVAPIARMLAEPQSLFSGSIGEYTGIIIRDVTPPSFTIADFIRAKEMAQRASLMIPTFRDEDGNECYACIITPSWADALFTPEQRCKHRAAGIALLPERRVAA